MDGIMSQSLVDAGMTGSCFEVSGSDCGIVHHNGISLNPI